MGKGCAKKLEAQGLCTMGDILNRHLTIAAGHVLEESEAPQEKALEQLDLFTDYNAVRERQAQRQRTSWIFTSVQIESEIDL